MEPLQFETGEQLLLICERENITIAEAMLRREMHISELSKEEIRQEMQKNLAVMKESVEKGLLIRTRSASGLSGGDANKLSGYPQGYLGSTALAAVAASMAVVEVNAAMGRIVAAPTAGASGILPGTLITFAKTEGWDDEALLDALFTAGAIGMLIALAATISGADGGCQAETGTGAAMAAAALVALKGGSPRSALNAAAMALKNVMGLVCDPVAGLVECPCIKRNALGASNAMLCADMALAGIESIIPFDEVISSMGRVGHALPEALRETALGGVAATPTGKAVSAMLRNKK